MLLKLLLPYHDRGILGGVIVKWHKAEGEWINYGDDLFDLKVEELRGLKHQAGGERLVQTLTSPQVARRLMRVKDLMMEDAEPPEQAYGMGAGQFYMRITASDAGALRRVRAREGEYRKVGDLLALLTTEEQEPVPEGDQGLDGVSTFRAVTNFLPQS
jgi:hypothetical protein